MLLFFRNIEKTEVSQILTALDFEPNTKIPSPWHNRWIALSQKPRLSLCFLCTTSSATAHKQVTQLHWPYWRSCGRKYGFSVSLEIFGSWIIMDHHGVFSPQLNFNSVLFFGHFCWLSFDVELIPRSPSSCPGRNSPNSPWIGCRRHNPPPRIYWPPASPWFTETGRFFPWHLQLEIQGGLKSQVLCWRPTVQNWWLLMPMPMPWSF